YLEECIKSAENISKDNHFYIIQFPFNLYERGAVTNKNQADNTMTLLEYAGKYNIGTIVNRPLNALTSKGLNRLADFAVNPEYMKLDEGQIIAEMSLLESMEEDFLKDYLEILSMSKEN